MELALRRIKVSEAALATAPPITLFFKNAEGGIAQVITAMRFSKDEAVLQFLKKYDKLPVVDRQYLPLEAVALAAGVDLNRLLGAAMTALQSQAANVSRIIAVTSHPKITKARVRWGLKAGGERDRTAIDTALGVLPSPKGPTFIGKAIFGKNGSDEDEPEEINEEGPDVDRLFPRASANGLQEQLNSIRQRALPETT